MLGNEGTHSRHGEGAPRVEELPEGHPDAAHLHSYSHARVEEPDEDWRAHVSTEPRDERRHHRHYRQQEPRRAQYDGYGAAPQQQPRQQYHEPPHPQHQQPPYAQPQQPGYYQEQQQYQGTAQQAVADPFAGAFMPFGAPFGGGMLGGMGFPFGGMGGGLGGFDSMFGNMFSQMNNMMRQMDSMVQATSQQAAAGTLPQGTTFVSHTATYNSDGRRATTTTRASGGVRETQAFVDDGTGQQRCTIARGIGDRERVVTRKRDAAGQFHTDDQLRGVQDAHAFDDEWRRAAEQRLPRGGLAISGGGGSGGRQQQQRLSLPGRGGDAMMQQQQQGVPPQWGGQQQAQWGHQQW